MQIDLSKLSETELLNLHADIIDELKSRDILRTKNNPVGDYAEWLVANALGLELAPNSSAGYDAKDKQNLRYQVKARRITPDNKSRQLSAIRNLKDKDFDFLVAIIFDQNYKILDAVMMPHEVIADYATYRSHTNAHVLHLRGPILEDARVKHLSMMKT